MTHRTRAVLIGALYLALIVAANYATTRWGMVWVFGLTATAGTYLAGATFAVRDSLQDAAGKYAALGLVVAGAALSYLVADPFIALASGVAFGLSELADLAVYTPLRRQGYAIAAMASNVVGAIVDTFLFLWIAGFPITGLVVSGQIVGKVAATLPIWALVAFLRFRKQA
jgi:uncharacterized PurR-regulated membrane protein YhhQ (DUF165 family)